MTGYVHWRRFDWSLDSICPNCLATIANAKDEADLAEYERNHVCTPVFLAERALQNSSLAKMMDFAGEPV
jgi:hypothetical protein